MRLSGSRILVTTFVSEKPKKSLTRTKSSNTYAHIPASGGFHGTNCLPSKRPSLTCRLCVARPPWLSRSCRLPGSWPPWLSPPCGLPGSWPPWLSRSCRFPGSRPPRLSRSSQVPGFQALALSRATPPPLGSTRGAMSYALRLMFLRSHARKAMITTIKKGSVYGVGATSLAQK